jgi:hypothetical protein
MKYKILFISALVIFTSCCREAKYYNIPDDERFKFQDDDRFIYIGEKGTIDTLQIWKIDNYYFHYGWSLNLSSAEVYEEVNSITINKISFPPIPNFIGFSQMYTYEKIIEFNFSGLDNTTNIEFIYTNSDRSGIKSYTYNGEKFTLYRYIPAQ